MADPAFDIANFESEVVPVLRKPRTQLSYDDSARRRAAVEPYRGDLLIGSYDSWVIRSGERLDELLLCVLARLVVWHRDRGELDEAIALAERVLEPDPLREDVHRTVMRLYARTGGHVRVGRPASARPVAAP